MRIRLFTILFLLISFIGFIDAIYLTGRYYSGDPITCSFNFLSACDSVTMSAHAIVFGVPVALLGAGYYITLFMLAAASFIMFNGRLLTIASYATVFGLAASVWFVYVQAFVLNAFCLYCIISAVASPLLFIMGMLYVVYYKKAYE